MAKLKNSGIFFCILFLIPVFLPAQTAAELETVLGTQSVTCAQAVQFVCASADVEAPEGQYAFAWAVEQGWLSKDAAADDPINLARLSFIMMKAFDIKGGMMYRLAPGPRYAFRTMVSRSFIQGAADPAMNLNGERFLLILGKVLNATEG
jgi:hypothetical protein